MTGFSASPSQRAAIEAPRGAHLVLAGPGSGKTFCLIERIRFLVEHHGVEPAQVLAVTFTNKAAGEVASRLKDALGDRADLVTRGTIHSLCVTLLREHGAAIGLPRGFGIAHEDYQVEVLRRLGVYDAKRARGTLQRFGVHRLTGRELAPGDASLFDSYRTWLDARSILDFDDLIVRTRELLAIPDVQRLANDRWEEVLIDEAQDLSPAQFDVLAAIVGPRRHVFAVGDDEQSIFSWTGADPKVLRSLMNDFGIVEPIVLLENRRTSRPIFESARRLLVTNPMLFEKPVTAVREAGGPVEVRSFPDDDAEAEWLLSELRSERERGGLAWGDYAVLYRRHEIGSRLESVLMRAGIPSRLAMGKALQDDPVVQYLLAALKVIAAPDDPVHAEALARVVLPEALYQRLRADANRDRQAGGSAQGIMAWLRGTMGSRARESAETRMLWRLIYLLENLAALGARHTRLTALVEELLAQRVGQFRTLLEERHDDLSDPAADPAVVALAGELALARHGRRRVVLPRMGGQEMALAGLLRGAGITAVAFCDPDGLPREGDLLLDPATFGPLGPALGLFKALQLLHAGTLPDTFQDFVAFDLETTDRDVATAGIVEVAAVRVRGGQVVAEFHSLVRPRVPIAEGAREQHGYSEADLAGAPWFEEVWPRFREFVGADVLVAHNGHRFDFPVLRRMAGDAMASIPPYDTLPLAREVCPGRSARLGDLAQAFGIPLDRAHHALDDARALAGVARRLEELKQVRLRKTSLANLLDWLGLALAVGDTTSLGEEAGWLHRATRVYAMGRYSDCLQEYAVERERPGAAGALTINEVIDRLGGQEKLAKVRSERSAFDRYPAAMARLNRILDAVGDGTLAEQLQQFMEMLALSRSAGEAHDPDRVNLLTLHATKGLEFSRVFIAGVEDRELPGMPPQRDLSREEVEEARRLLYVGMTRAMDRLVLTRAQVRNGCPSGGIRFLEEMGLG